MRFGLAGAFLTAGFMLVGSGLARAADDGCIGPMRAVEKMNGNYGTVEQLSQTEVDGLAKVYAEANEGRKLTKANSALVFHRPDAPLVAWIILFRDGCAIGEAPILEETVKKGLAAAGSPAAPQSAPDSKSAADPKSGDSK